MAHVSQCGCSSHKGLSGIGDSLDDARSYLRRKWVEFTQLGPRLIDMQHRAAVAAGQARERGDTAKYEAARQIIRQLGQLNVKHGQALDTMAGVAPYVGLSGYVGLGAVPVAAVTAITGLALTVAWFFRAYAAEARALDLIEAGQLTPQEYQAIRAGVGAVPGDLLGGVTDLAKVAVFGGVAWLAFQVFQAYNPAPRRRKARKNPPLVTFDVNPPGETFGEQVYAILYRHAEDGGDWIHEFGPGVEMAAEDDGTISIAHRNGRRIWEEF